MTMFLAPYTAIADIDGSPLDAGFLFFGEYGKDPELFPVEVFWDSDFTVPVAQPIRTRNGYPVRNGSPTKVYLKTAQHSIAIKNRNSAFILVDFFNKGWDASSVVDASGETQQEVNLILGLEFYVEMWGAKGDGVTSDKAAFTNAMNDLHTAYKFDGRPRTLLLQPNKTYIGHLLPLKAGVSIRCANGRPIIKRTPVPGGTLESEAKWWRVFLVDEASFTTLADISNRISLENFIIDGNMYNSQWTWNTYNQQQASCLYLAGRSNISINGVTQEWMRVRFNLQNVKCQNSVSDGLHVRGNVDLTFSNLEFEHCFRGGLTLTGGNSIIKGNDVTAFDARIDLEVDGTGIGGSYKSWIYLKDYWQDVAQAGKERFFTGGCDFTTHPA